MTPKQAQGESARKEPYVLLQFGVGGGTLRAELTDEFSAAIYALPGEDSASPVEETAEVSLFSGENLADAGAMSDISTSSVSHCMGPIALGGLLEDNCRRPIA